jgi:glycosyltransferase involved in cell wall biosynthesis
MSWAATKLADVDHIARPVLSVAGVFLVGNTYGHHAAHSGYQGFQRFVGRMLRPPVGFRFLKIKGFPLLGWRIDQAIAKLMRRECYSLALFLTEAAAAVHMMGHKGSIYHVLYGDTDLCWLGRVRKLLGTRVVATFHEGAEGLEYLKIDQRLVKSLDAVILVSESQRSYFAGLVSAERIFVVPHGVDTEFFHPGDQPFAEPVYLTIGGHLRDFETLKLAIDRVHREIPTARFIAVGAEHGHNGSRFVHPRVEFLQGISDEQLRSLYQRAILAVFSFKQSTANNSVLEAMACGLPVLATNVGGVREYVGEGGILCPQFDSVAMADAMVRIYRDPSLAAQLGSTARSRALQFDYRLAADRQSQVYAKILELARENTECQADEIFT